MKNLKPWLPVIFIALWAVINLLFLEIWPSLLTPGDEAWFSDVAWNLARKLRLANTVFPLTPLEEGLGVIAETFYYIPLAAIFKLAGVGLLQARLLSLVAAAATVLVLAYRLRKTPVWLAVALSPSLLLAAHIARPEATGVMLVTIYIILALSDAWVFLGILGGLSFFVSPIVGLWTSGAFLAWLIVSRGCKTRLWATALFAASFLAGLGLTALLGGFYIFSYNDFGLYYVPLFHDQNPLFLLKAIAKKTYWPLLLKFKDPVITLLFLFGLVLFVARGFRVRRDEAMAWLFAASGIVFSGLGISRTPDYYFVYMLVPAAFVGGLALRGTRQIYSYLVIGAIGLAGLGKTLMDVSRLPRSDPPSRIVALKENIPDGAGVLGPTNLWYLLHEKRLIVPLFVETVGEKGEFLARLGSLSPGFAVFTDRDTSGWLWEIAREGALVCRVPFNGYIVSSRTGKPEPVRELTLYRLKPPETWPGRDETGGP